MRPLASGLASAWWTSCPRMSPPWTARPRSGTRSSAPRPSCERRMARQPTILNVDDYLPGRYARSRVLREAGFNVIEAANGEEALRLVRERMPDVVLLDNNLPDISGMEVCRLIKAAPETEAIPVLQLSATSRALEAKIEAMSKGADTYLTEPIAPAELVAHVRAALRW